MHNEGPETDEEIRAILTRRRRGAVWKGADAPTVTAGTICEFIPPSIDRSNIDWLESWIGSPAAGAVLRIERSVVRGDEEHLRYAPQVRLVDVVALIDALHIVTDVVGRLVAEREVLQEELTQRELANDAGARVTV